MVDRQQTVGHGITVGLCVLSVSAVKIGLWIHYRRDAEDDMSLSNGIP